MADRRKHKRWLLNANFEAYTDKRDKTLGYMAEISYGGMMLVAKEPIQTNIIMPLRVSLENAKVDKREIKVVTQVVRCHKDEDLELFKTGFRLIDLSTETRDIIDQLIQVNAVEQNE